MALPNREYESFLGMQSKSQSYDCVHYGAPVYHCVYPIESSIDADELADEVLQYQHDLHPVAPTMCLAFRARGVVWPDLFETRAELVAEITQVQQLCEIGSSSLIRCSELKSFMGSSAFIATVKPFIIIYDIDSKLSGMKVAEEAVEHLAELRKNETFDRLLLRWPNGGTVDVEFFSTVGGCVSSLNTAIQRARTMEFPTRFF